LVIACVWFFIVPSIAGADAKPLNEGQCPVPMIHVTDLFRPHDDPDDHWDLACVFALAAEGKADLRGVLIDYPRPERENDPDVLAVAQLNYLTGKTVPVMVGASRWMEPAEFANPENAADLGGIRAMLDIMREAPGPVVINVLGSCRDVASAGRMAPDLFAKKCRAVYLNAGSGTPDPSKAVRLEWNVRLDPRGYDAVFDLPCPIYWMPCFEEVRADPSDLFRVAEYGTFYRFRQGDVLPHLSAGMQNFFAYAFEHGRFVSGRAAAELRPNWLHYLKAGPSPGLMDRINAMDRNMWCTGGFLHAVGQTVSRDGKIVPVNSADAVFTFEPIDVACSPDGVTHWTSSSARTNRFLFHVRDVDRYPAAMTSALRSLLTKSQSVVKD
jgi:hypothetical protein